MPMLTEPMLLSLISGVVYLAGFCDRIAPGRLWLGSTCYEFHDDDTIKPINFPFKVLPLNNRSRHFNMRYF